MSIQLKKATELRKRWKEMGNKSCNHPHTEKEYMFGSATGDYICTTCGAAFYEGEEMDDSEPKSDNN